MSIRKVLFEFFFYNETVEIYRYIYSCNVVIYVNI